MSNPGIPPIGHEALPGTNSMTFTRPECAAQIIDVLRTTANRIAVSHDHTYAGSALAAQQRKNFDYAVGATIASANALMRSLGGLPIRFQDPDTEEETTRLALGIHGYKAVEDLWVVAALKPSSVELMTRPELLGIATSKLGRYFQIEQIDGS